MAGVFIIDTRNNKILVGLEIKQCILNINSFGGMTEATDTNSLYTAIRELVEELFNFHPNIETIHNLIDISKDYILYVYKTHKSTSYIMNIDVLNHYFNYFSSRSIPTVFDRWDTYISHIDKFIHDRKITSKSHNGLNEIKEVFLLPIDYIYNIILRDTTIPTSLGDACVYRLLKSFRLRYYAL